MGWVEENFEIKNGSKRKILINKKTGEKSIIKDKGNVTMNITPLRNKNREVHETVFISEIGAVDRHKTYHIKPDEDPEKLIKSLKSAYPGCLVNISKDGQRIHVFFNRRDGKS
jgi:uncharacterized protein (DUF2249 family)